MFKDLYFFLFFDIQTFIWPHPLFLCITWYQSAPKPQICICRLKDKDASGFQRNVFYSYTLFRLPILIHSWPILKRVCPQVGINNFIQPSLASQADSAPLGALWLPKVALSRPTYFYLQHWQKKTKHENIEIDWDLIHFLNKQIRWASLCSAELQLA